MVALCGLLGGVIAWPALRGVWYLRQARSPETAKRLQAINILAALCARDPTIAPDLIGVVLDERRVGTPESRRVVDRMAVWAAERCPGIVGQLTRRLDSVDDETYLHIADLLRETGDWRRPARTFEQLAKREVLRMRSEEPATRLGALQALADLGPGVSDVVADAVTPWLRDPFVEVRQAVVRTASICLDDRTVHPALQRAMADAAGAVRTEAVLRSGLRDIETPVERLLDGDAQVRQAAAWAMGMHPAPPAAEALLRVACTDSDAAVRGMAVWSLGRQAAPPLSPPVEFLAQACAGDAILAARVMIAAGRIGWAGLLYESFRLNAQPAEREAAVAAVFACGRIPAGTGERDVVVRSLRSVVEESLRSGRGELAAAACEALAALGDRPFAPVLRDIAAQIDDEPMLQYAAAVAALRLDESLGTEALTGLLRSDKDEISDLAAIRLGELSRPPIEVLAGMLGDADERSRASAALALGFAGAMDADVAGERFDEFLRRRTNPESDAYERAWKPHGYYLCARLLLGDAVREQLDPFIRNESFCRVGLYAALLRAGDSLPMDLLLARDSTIDVESFLADARFIEIVAARFPKAPSFEWFEDRPLRLWQTERLRDWWAIHRWRIPGAASENARRPGPDPLGARPSLTLPTETAGPQRGR